MPLSTLEALRPASTTACSAEGRLITVVRTNSACSKGVMPSAARWLSA
jgi:hypothetical protein